LPVPFFCTPSFTGKNPNFGISNIETFARTDPFFLQ
jgi:hypothetical protein